MRRLPVFALGLMLATTACLEDTPTNLDPQFANAATGQAGEAMYRVTVYNLTEGQPFTPVFSAVHRNSLSLFEVGQPASFEIQQIAENGNLGPMVDFAGTNRHVVDAAVHAGPPPGPVMPGAMLEFDVSGRTGAKYLSLVAMLICTNDGFTGVSGIRLPKKVGDVATMDAYGYDAGTEMNTEAWGDLVPPCAPLTGFGPQGGTGMSNPDLAEGGVITMHGGIAGDTDLQADPHGWAGPVATIMVERIS